MPWTSVQWMFLDETEPGGKSSGFTALPSPVTVFSSRTLKVRPWLAPAVNAPRIRQTDYRCGILTSDLCLLFELVETLAKRRQGMSTRLAEQQARASAGRACI